MTKIKVRTKIEIICASIFLLLLTTMSVISVTRTITNSTDSISTFIRNSNGNYWNVTGTNLQTAIYDLNNTGGVVNLPAGTIPITTSIQLVHDVSLVGASSTKTIIYSNSAAMNCPIWIGPGDDNVTIRDLTINMNCKGSNGIYIRGANYVTIDNIHLINSGYQGIYISPDGGTRFSHFTNIWVKQGDCVCSHGIGINNANNSIFSNIICENYDLPHEVGEDGMDITDCFNTTFDNIIIRGGGWGDGIKISASETYTSHCIFSNIIISDAGVYGMKLQHTEYCDFSNIVLLNTSYISIYGGANLVHHCNFNNIIVSDSHSLGFYVAGQNLNFNNMQINSPAGSGIQIADNACDLSFSNCNFINPGNYNVIYSGCTRINFVNCEFIGGASYGFSIQGASYFKFSNCLFKDNTLDGIDTTITPCNNYSIISCTFRNNAEGVDCNNNDNYIFITLNSFINDTLDDHYSTKGYVANNIGDDI